MAVAAAYAAWASGTAPFTPGADAAVAAPGAVFLAVFALQRRWPTRGPWQRLRDSRPEGHGGAAGWLVVIGVLVGIELASYFHGGPRSAYPTLSSAIDSISRWRAVRAALWSAWLAIGWFLVRR